MPKRLSQAHPFDTRTVDAFMLDEMRKPKLWAGGFVVTLFVLLFIIVILLGGPTPA